METRNHDLWTTRTTPQNTDHCMTEAFGQPDAPYQAEADLDRGGRGQSPPYPC